MRKKVVLITGCSSGIGRALSMEFLQCGFQVVATARQLDAISDLKEQGMSTLALNVNDKDQVKQVVEKVIDREKSIDVLVNNAGYALIGPSIEVPENELIQQFETNVFSTLFLAKAVAPHMKDQKKGMIINIGSISGIATSPFSGAYCASKAALHSLSDALRMELDIFGIHVMTVQPGKIQTGFGNAAEATISRVVKPGSWYEKAADAIQSRAQESQTNATPAHEFAKRLVRAVMMKNPPAVVRIGKMSTFLPLIKQLIPTNLMDKIFKNKFGLNRMDG